MKTTYQKSEAVFSGFFLTRVMLAVLPVFLLAGCQTEKTSTATASATSAAAISSKVAQPTPNQPVVKPASTSTQIIPKEMNLFDGKTLGGWQITDFGGHGEVEVVDGELRVYMGADLSGVNWTNSPLPKVNYEIELDAKKLDGSDFFCGLTVPVRESYCSLILGGWGGGITGISSIDGMDASENETSKSLYFEKNRWFHIRLRVLDEKILAWIDDQKIIDVGTKDRKIAMRVGDIERSIPLGIATWQTSSALKNIKLRQVSGE